MATTSHPTFARNSNNLSGRDPANDGKYTDAQRPAEDDDSIVTEDFPEFDPSHDGSEAGSSESSGSEHYTHTATEERNGAKIHGGFRASSANGFAMEEDDAVDEVALEEHGQQTGTPASSIDRPVFSDGPESQHPARRRDVPSSSSNPHQNGQESPARLTSPITSPPYWAHGHTFESQATSRARSASAESLVPRGGITLQDNEADDDTDDNNGARHSEETTTRTSYGRDRNKACWAKSVEVTSFVVVNGSATNIGAFVVWNIRVQTLQGPYMNIRKRYSEFDDFRRDLIRTFPSFEAAVPVLPPKSTLSRFRPRFLEKRRAGLQYFLNCILLNPEFSGSPVLKCFLFS